MFSSQNSQVSSDANYIEDVFSTWLYTGNGSTQTITNGIDLSTKGGMVITKARSIAYGNILVDTTRGVGNILQTSTTNAQIAESTAVTGVSTTGFSVGSYSNTNGNGQTFASWTFREQPKFFDVVTYTGNGASNRQISHNLGSVPGCFIIKETNFSGTNWRVYHRSLGNANEVYLNTTSASTATTSWASTTPTSTVFTVGVSGGAGPNDSGSDYVAYLFAHDAGGFGLTGNDNVISCGSYVGNGSTPNNVTLGYEPQWILIKDITGSTNPWVVVDNMRGMSLTNRVELYPNTSGAELTSATNRLSPTATGFFLNGDNSFYNTNGSTYIYIAIRRGPMKVPTSGTSVYNAVTYSGTGATRVLDASIVPDIYMGNTRTPTGGPIGLFVDRLRGDNTYIQTTSTGAESTVSPTRYFSGQTGFGLDTTADNVSGRTYVSWFMRRAPSFFDEVCYTGTGSARTISHNLGVAPELMITKQRSGTSQWNIYQANLGASAFVQFTTAAVTTGDSTRWNSTAPTSSVFSLGTSASLNSSGQTYVWYGFATCAGVSKVGSYTGTGTTKQVDCGFTSGARFVLIKRTDSTGDWYVWDSARGIVAGNDPYLLLNSTAAEVTSTDYVDTYSAGFEISSTAPAAINASGGTFIFLAIA